jgi:hypothetical protein
MRRTAWTLALLLILVPLAACDGSGSTATPTTPATAAAAATPSPTSPSINAAIDLSFITPEGSFGAGVQAPVVGIVAKVSGTCPDLTFVLSGVTIHLAAATKIEGGVCADIKEGMRAGAIGTKRTDGSVDAQRVKIGPPPPLPVTGIVASLAGACPNLTFVLDGVTIHTSGKTVFEGGACGDLKNGMRAGAIGPKQSDGSVDAEHVKMAATPPPPPPPPGSTVGGIVGSLAGACPSVTFIVSGTTVRTSSRTVFEGGTCSDLKDGVRAGAMGPKASDGSIDAEKVKFPPATPPPPPPGSTAGGVVGSLSGTCPSVTFIVSGTTVRTSSRTVFEGGTCSDLKDGVRAGAMGQKASDGSIDAEKVKFPPATPPPGANPVSGPVVSVSGACPDLTFVIGTTTIHTNAKTTWVNGTCADIKVGVKAGAMGPKRSDGSIDAEKAGVMK